MFTGHTQNIEGGPIEAATAKTLASQARAAAAAKALGAGMKGSARRRYRGGAVNLNASIPVIPEANSIKGVSHVTNHLNAVNNLNQIRADKVYDNLINATPMKVGGFRFRDAEEMYPGSGTHEDTIRSRKSKKHGRRSKRTHRRKRNKSSTRRRGRGKRI